MSDADKGQAAVLAAAQVVAHGSFLLPTWSARSVLSTRWPVAGLGTEADTEDQMPSREVFVSAPGCEVLTYPQQCMLRSRAAPGVPAS